MRDPNHTSDEEIFKTKYEQLKKVIQEANPEIMELKFGCRMQMPFYNGESVFCSIEGDVITFVDSKGGTREEDKAILENGLILGRPIRLADVLLAIDKVDSDYSISCFGSFEKWKSITTDQFLLEPLSSAIRWNLRDDNLDHQSLEFKDFLINLLV